MILFISDLHLHPSRPAITELFHGFAAGPAGSAEALYILGDLFDHWAGDDDCAEPANAEVCTALRRLGERGTAVYFMSGNRDLLVDRGFAAASGATLIDEPQVVDIAGSGTLLLHGDILCTDDTEYQRYRATVRDPLFRQSFLAKPLTERKAFIGGLRERSESEKRTKAAEIMDVNADAIAAAFRRHGVARMIHGHTHRQARHVHTVDGRPCERWVLGDWRDDVGNYLECMSGGWSFRSWHGKA